ncbi:MAG: DNA gyrase subunit A [Phototrophicaceae bacterium]
MALGNIRTVNINEEMRGSYLDYAMSVIVARALPDARDGLKPVHRRILFAMHDMGIRANTAYKKSARIVGEVLGKYHPHGDSAVYDSMARMAQDFSLRYMLIDGQGNFGSVDGDRPAAMRYTEARMANITEEMLADIDMNTVDFGDNYDGQQQEPLVLPARIPNLLINGASGIAVGMATNIPPHNLREVAAATEYIIDHYDEYEDITVDDMMRFVTGPDFPTGGVILADDELKEAYATGRGRIIVRARYHMEAEETNYPLVVFTEIPYQVSKSTIIERIASLVREGRLEGIRDLRDESDRDGMRLVIELKRGAQVLTVINRMFKYTQLQSTFGIQMLALVNGEPRLLSIKKAIKIYIDHRYEVIVRRSEYELGKLRARSHILEGLIKALDNVEAIIQTIRNAQDTETARLNLVNRFDLTETQANAILEMQLRRLAALEQVKLREEHQVVRERMNYLEALLASPAKILSVIREDVTQMSLDYGDVRRTTMSYERANLEDSELIDEEDIIVTLTRNGYVKRVLASEYRAQRRGGKGVIGMTTRDEDGLSEIFYCNTHDTILFFTDKGKVYSEIAWNIPVAGRAAKGILIQSILTMEMDERVTAVLPARDFKREGYFVMATVAGRIKRVELSEFAAVRPSGLIAIRLEDGDTLGWVKYTNGEQDIIMASQQGMSIRFSEGDVRVMGRPAAGVNGLKLDEGDIIVSMDSIRPEDTHILVVTERGMGKLTPTEEYRTQQRYGSGIKTVNRSEKTGNVVALCSVHREQDLLIITDQGTVIRSSLTQVRETGRSAQGVILIHLGGGDRIAGITLLDAAAEEEDVLEGEVIVAPDLPVNGNGHEV